MNVKKLILHSIIERFKTKEKMEQKTPHFKVEKKYLKFLKENPKSRPAGFLRQSWPKQMEFSQFYTYIIIILPLPPPRQG